MRFPLLREQRLDPVSRNALTLAATPPPARTAPPRRRWTLKRLQAWLQAQGQNECCRETIRQALKRLELRINVLPLSAYSPDFMPVEHLWQWIREDVTYPGLFTKKGDSRLSN